MQRSNLLAPSELYDQHFFFWLDRWYVWRTDKIPWPLPGIGQLSCWQLSCWHTSVRSNTQSPEENGEDSSAALGGSCLPNKLPQRPVASAFVVLLEKLSLSLPEPSWVAERGQNFVGSYLGTVSSSSSPALSSRLDSLTVYKPCVISLSPKNTEAGYKGLHWLVRRPRLRSLCGTVCRPEEQGITQLGPWLYKILLNLLVKPYCKANSFTVGPCPFISPKLILDWISQVNKFQENWPEILLLKI